MFSVGKVQVAPGLTLVTRCAHYRNRHRGSLHTVRLPANFWSNRCAQGEVPRMELGRPTAGLFHSMSRNLRCPLWVISGHGSASIRCPLYPQKQTLITSVEMSALCQKRTPAPQQRTSLFDHFVGAREQLR